jgi:hypothetical protein
MEIQELARAKVEDLERLAAFLGMQVRRGSLHEDVYRRALALAIARTSRRLRAEVSRSPS